MIRLQRLSKPAESNFRCSSDLLKYFSSYGHGSKRGWTWVETATPSTNSGRGQTSGIQRRRSCLCLDSLQQMWDVHKAVAVIPRRGREPGNLRMTPYNLGSLKALFFEAPAGPWISQFSTPRPSSRSTFCCFWVFFQEFLFGVYLMYESDKRHSSSRSILRLWISTPSTLHTSTERKLFAARQAQSGRSFGFATLCGAVYPWP